MAVLNRDLATRLSEDMNNDLRRARRLTLSEWRRRPLLQKTREHFWSYFSEVF